MTPHERMEQAMLDLGLTEAQRAYVHSYVRNALAENERRERE